MNFGTREEWLLKAIDILAEEKFKSLGHKFNKIRISVGFPSSKKAIGEWWKPESTEDNHATIFIHPGKGDPVDILGVLVHELVHDAAGIKAGHGPEFKKIAIAVGLTGKMRSAMPGPVLKGYLQGVVKKLGRFPHSPLKSNAKPPRAKQTTRMLKMICRHCGYICRASLTAITDHGPVHCPCNEQPMLVEMPE